MNEDKIKRCIKQQRGIELIEIKPHLSKAYMEEAEETLENVFLAKGKWKVITSYYACYNALYSILMRCEIKCEIHDCTLELIEFFDFEDSEIRYLKKLKEDRIQVRYYLKNLILEDETEVKNFVVKCKTVLNSLDDERVENIRNKIREIMGS